MASSTGANAVPLGGLGGGGGGGEGGAKRSEKTTKKRGWRTLAPLLQAFLGEIVSVELKSGMVLTGILDTVDHEMNVWLGKVETTWMEGRRKGEVGPTMELTYVSSSKMRYVHFPDRLNIDAQVKRMVHRGKQGAYEKQSFVR